jgi:D-alanine-D-alanine ligase
VKIGLTYDLKSYYLAQGYNEESVSECDTEATIELLGQLITSYGHDLDYIGNIENLVSFLARGDRWDYVFNFAEGMHGTSREAQVPALLDAYQIPYTFSDSRLMAIVLDKSITKSILASAGISTAPYWVVKSLEDLEKIPNSYPLFAKPIGEGSSKGVYSHSRVTNSEELRSLCLELLKNFTQPVLVEEFLPGREMTVGILGTGDQAQVLGVLEIFFLENPETAVYCHATKKDWDGKVDYRVIEDEAAHRASLVALKAWQHLGGRDCGRIDIRFDSKGGPQFIELNVIPGLASISDIVILAQKIGITHRELIGRILASCEQRLKK